MVTGVPPATGPKSGVKEVTAGATTCVLLGRGLCRRRR